MKIVNNVVEESKIEKAGDILMGEASGDYYIVLYDTKLVLNLRTLAISEREDTHLRPTSIRKENITITFN